MIKQISPQNTSDSIFGSYFGVQKLEKILIISKFDILMVPPIQIPPKKGKNLDSCKKNSFKTNLILSYYQYVIALGICMENRTKSLFYSGLFNKCHYRTYLIAFLFSILYSKDNGVLSFLKFWVLRVTYIQIPTQNGKMKVLFNKFLTRTNRTTILITI
jgi:hypothetical protein